MKVKGKEYKAAGEQSEKRGVFRRRAVYLLDRSPTYEQQSVIDSLERGFHGNWGGRDPYELMRRAEALGIELREEERGRDGKWLAIPDPDVPITNMTAGAL